MRNRISDMVTRLSTDSEAGNRVTVNVYGYAADSDYAARRAVNAARTWVNKQNEARSQAPQPRVHSVESRWNWPGEGVFHYQAVFATV